MSLLREDHLQHCASVSFHEHPEVNEIIVGHELWTKLGVQGEHATIALTPASSIESIGSSSLIVNATCDTTITGLHVPYEWSIRYRWLFSYIQNHKKDINVNVSLVQLLPLSELVLSPLCAATWDIAQSDPKAIEQAIFQPNRIIRVGDVISLKTTRASFEDSSISQGFRVLIAEPISQGYAESGMTKLLVVPMVETGGEQHLSKEALLDYEHHHGDQEEDQTEVDENFLLNSISSSAAPNRGLLEPTAVSTLNLLAQTLPSKFQLAGLNDDTVMIGTSDILKLGVFSGDWVLISNDTKVSQSRLVRVIAADEEGSIIKPGHVAVPSVLLHNLTSSVEESTALKIQSTPFGKVPPPIPTANSISIARIASPISVHRKYQTLLIHSIRSYFDGRKRLIKQNDLLAVPFYGLNEILVTNTPISEEQGLTIEELLGLFQDIPPPLESVAFFRVVNVEHNLLSDPASPPDNHFASTMGEFGCWMDPSSTRLIQVGVENARVPGLGSITDVDIPTDFLVNTSYLKVVDSLKSALHPSAARYQAVSTILLKGGRGVGKRTATRRAAMQMGVHVLEVDCYDVLDETEIKTGGTLKARFEQAAECAPCILLLRNIDSLARNSQKLETGKDASISSVLEECISDLRVATSTTNQPTILIATVHDVDVIPLGVLACFKQEISFESPSESERLLMLQNTIDRTSLSLDVSLESLARQTAAFVPADLRDLVQRARLTASQRIRGYFPDGENLEESLQAAGYVLTAADFDNALAKSRASISSNIGAPSIPKVAWDDVGGLGSVKSDIMDTIQLPLQHPELFANGLKKRSGILLYGPPGTGKTLLAKAVATSFSLNFFSVKGPELLNMYIGESEANVRRVFQRARDARPCVIFFDELDSVAPKRGNHGDSGGVMDRIVSQLLAELDGMSDGNGADVFVIGATNRPDLLDPAFLRPGRFDKLLYLGVSETHEAQLKIMEALTRKFRLDPSLDLAKIAEQCPFNYTGADFYALCSDAMLKTMSRKAAEVEAKIASLNQQAHISGHPYPLTPQYYLSEMASEDDTDVIVSQEDFEGALRELIPSVSPAEMLHYSTIQKQFAHVTEPEISSSMTDSFNEGSRHPKDPPLEDKKGKGRAT